MLPLPPFAYHRPRDLEEAVALLSELGPDAKLIAGGTDLLPNMKHGLLAPKHLIALDAISDLDRVEVLDDGSLSIGALTRLSDLAVHPTIRVLIPVLAEAAAEVASPQIRNMGTIGGNVCLDTRCVYYNQTQFWRSALGFCLKKDGDTCHVVKGGKQCVAACVGDTVPALIVLGAAARVLGPEGMRAVPLEALYTTPGSDHLKLARNEVIVRFEVPRPGERLRSGFFKLRLRRSIDFSSFSIAAALRLDGRTIQDLKLAAVALNSKPRVLNAEKLGVLGQDLTKEVMSHIGEQFQRRATPLDNINVDSQWRKEVIAVLVRRLLERVSAVGAQTASVSS
ncbi:MAG: hypothetical protein AUK47_16385 [Deltaproteobacteria bacterium CG2_30_63_29]|nr:MAG: hypothetical protein AUK47_16385 [Deltaproteobacteria bacterium CG2_30_63_29]PJB34718.1 MAG: 4-hydroxybenzoyl-CoA reductase subunit beta [Deltaproteobacteria bacterium CG_4_9_14_3_um_filter_63_12]